MIFKNLINNNKGLIIISDQIIDVRNYEEIISFDDNNFKIKIDNQTICIIGKNISVKLLKEEEIILSGDISKIEYR